MPPRSRATSTAGSTAGRAAQVFAAHDYEAADVDPDARGANTDPDAAPCAVCGSGAHAFIHSDEAANAGATVVVTDGDSATAGESAR